MTTELKTAEEWAKAMAADVCYDEWSIRVLEIHTRNIQANALRWARDGLTGYGLTDAAFLQIKANQLETEKGEE
jgi:hypothetical protein